MNQLSFDDLLDDKKELILCQLSSGFHWLRITSGHTPSDFTDRVHFSLNGFDNLYEATPGKDEILSRFNGAVKKLTWEEGIEYGKCESVSIE